MNILVLVAHHLRLLPRGLFPFLSLQPCLFYWVESDLGVYARYKNRTAGSARLGLDVLMESQVAAACQTEELGHVMGRCSRTLA